MYADSEWAMKTFQKKKNIQKTLSKRDSKQRDSAAPSFNSGKKYVLLSPLLRLANSFGRQIVTSMRKHVGDSSRFRLLSKESSEKTTNFISSGTSTRI